MQFDQTVNIKKSELRDLIIEAISPKFPKHRVKDVTFKIMNVGDDRFGGNSYDLTGVDVQLVVKEDGPSPR